MIVKYCKTRIDVSLFEANCPLLLYHCNGLPLCSSLRPSFLCDLCCLVSVLAAYWVLRSAVRGELLIPRARLAIMQRRAFLAVNPSAWNDLPFELQSLLMAHPSKFYISLKSFFVRGWTGDTSE